MRLPTYSEIAKNEHQLRVYEAPADDSLFVAGPPGSGKTVLAIARARTIADQGQDVVMVTFNRMLRRLVTSLTKDQPVRIQTMHQFVTQQFRKDVRQSAPKTPGDRYSFDWNAMFKILDSRGVKPSTLHVIVDEGQDLPSDFFRYLREFVATATTVFADEYQAIGQNASTLREIKTAGLFDDPLLLQFNHRNTPEIARVAQHFHIGEAPVLDTLRNPSGEFPRLLVRSEAEITNLIANWFRTRGHRVGVAVVRNATGQSLCKGLQQQVGKKNVQMYRYNTKNEDNIDLVEPRITILNVESIKGQEFDTVFVIEIDELLSQMTDMNRRKMYMLCSRAIDYLYLIHVGTSLPERVLNQCPVQVMQLES